MPLVLYTLRAEAQRRLNMLNFKHLAVIAAVSASALLGGCFTPTPQNTVYRFSEGVSFESIDGVLVSLDEAEVVIHKNEDFKLIITSGGGRIDAFNLLLDRLIRTNLHITTKVHTYAASAAAMMFILGDERIMNEDAVLIFHKSRIIVQGTHITANDMLLFLKGAHPSKTITDILSKVDRKLVLDTFKVDELIDHIIRIMPVA